MVIAVWRQSLGVAGPVASSLVHPLGGGRLVQPEEVSEDRGGELGGQIEQRGPASGLGVDADAPETLAEPGRGDRAAGQVPGEQPGGGGRGTDAPVAAPVTDQLEDSVGQRAGDGHVVPSEPDERLAVAAGDLTGGHNGDAGQRLAVEQQQAAGHPVGGVERGVAQQPGGQCPALVLAEGRAGRARRHRYRQPPAVAAHGGPGQEIPGQAGGGPGVQPLVDVGLAAGAQRGAAAAEPGEQARGGADVVAGVRGGGARPGGACGAGAQPAHHLPGGVGLH